MFEFVQGELKEHKETMEKIEVLEKKYDIKFPQLLKKYYSMYDGEKISLSKIVVSGYECEVAKIVPIIAEKMSFEKIVDNDKADGFISDSFYPLARDRGGNYYYWEADTEKVFLVYCDDYENPFEVTNSIKNFFDELK